MEHAVTRSCSLKVLAPPKWLLRTFPSPIYSTAPKRSSGNGIFFPHLIPCPVTLMTQFQLVGLGSAADELGLPPALIESGEQCLLWVLARRSEGHA